MNVILRSSWRSVMAQLLFLLVLSCGLAAAESLTLARAVQLALSHSTLAAAADADQQRAFASYQEARNAYIPQVVAGSGLGASVGFPLTLEGSAPSLFNVNSQSALINPALRQFVKSARVEWQASKLTTKDQRDAVIQDTVVTYTELDSWEQRLARLERDREQASRAETAVGERVKSGVDSRLELNKARLVSARVRMHVAEAQGGADVLRRHLSQLTGVPAGSMEIVSGSIPTLPEVNREDDLSARAVDASPAVKAADQHALAESLRASGEHRALLPTVDFAAQYALLSRFNNYDVFYKSFQRNNASIGVAIRFPFLNPAQWAHAHAADAAALRATQDARSARNRLSEETLRLQRSVEQLAATRDVADLDFQLAQSNLDVVETRINSGDGTFHELADARTQANEKYLVLQDVAFQLARVRIALLRSTGELESWAMSGR